VEAILADFGRYLDPYRCPPAFVPVLAHWVGLAWLLPDTGPAPGRADHEPALADGALRHLVRHAAELAMARGTRQGLERMLDLATGHPGFAIGHGVDGFSIEVRGPAAAGNAVALVARIVRHEKPAFTTAAIGFGDTAAVPLHLRDQPSQEVPT
jgi:phage tail-like protein